MTDEIDLDELDAGTEADEPSANEGDWLWRDDESAEPPDERRSPSSDAADDSAGDEDTGAVPHVPYADRGKPAGIPKESGGSGGGAGAESTTTESESAEADGPHGGGADDMTLALTYEAVTRLADPGYAFTDASEWSDWIGIVGDVPTHVINKFQREQTLDADFFNGSGTGPRERLAGIDEHSMFYADRFVLLGCEDEADYAPEEWEFLRLEDAAENAGWELG